MREVTTGWERGDDVVHHGWSVDTGTMDIVATILNLDSQSNGGSGAIRSNVGARITSPPFRNGAHREGWCRAYLNIANVSTADWYLVCSEGANDQFTIHLDGDDRFLRIRLGGVAGSVIATDDVAISAGAYHRIEVHYFIDNSAGFIHVYVDDDGSYSSPYLSVTSTDTQFGSNNYSDRWRVQLDHADTRMDEFAVNSYSLKIDGGSGSMPSSGTTVTGGTSGATGIVHGTQGGVTDGRLILHTVSGSFINNETVTGGTLTALVDAPNGTYVGGLEPESMAPGEGFIVYLGPTGIGNTTDLDNTGEQTENYEHVDDNPVDTTTEAVYTGTTGEYDTYVAGNLPSSANSINVVEVHARAYKDGTTINQINGTVRTGGADFHSESQFDQNMSASADHHSFPFTLNPDTGGRWTPSEVDAAEVGGRLSA